MSSRWQHNSSIGRSLTSSTVWVVVLGVVPHLSAFQHSKIELRHQVAAIYKIPVAILVNVPFSYVLRE